MNYAQFCWKWSSLLAVLLVVMLGTVVRPVHAATGTLLTGSTLYPRVVRLEHGSASVNGMLVASTNGIIFQSTNNGPSGRHTAKNTLFCRKSLHHYFSIPLIDIYNPVNTRAFENTRKIRLWPAPYPRNT